VTSPTQHNHTLIMHLTHTPPRGAAVAQRFWRTILPLLALLCATAFTTVPAWAGSWVVKPSVEDVSIRTNPKGYAIGTLYRGESFYRADPASSNPSVDGYIWGYAYGTANLSGWVDLPSMDAGGSASPHGPNPGEERVTGPGKDYLLRQYAAFVNDDDSDGTQIRLIAGSATYGNYHAATRTPHHRLPIELRAGDYVKWRWVSKDRNVVMVALRPGYMPDRVTRPMWVFIARSALAGSPSQPPQQSGSVQVHMRPPEAAAAGAHWRIDGGPWQPSGTVVHVAPAYYTISFSAVAGWNTPASQPVGVFPGQALVAYGDYSAQPGALQVHLGPQAAIDAGARWQVDGGAWQSSGTTVSLAAGAHTVAFSSVPNRDTPASQVVNIAANQTTTVSADYPEQPGTLQVSISPQDAVNNGAQWQVDGGAWQVSGATVSLAPGSHIVAYNSLPGWKSPGTQTVQIRSNETASVSGAYRRDTRPFVAAPTITPDGATFTGVQEVSLMCETPGAVIRYTLDGSVPTGTGAIYREPLFLKDSCTVTARAFLNGGESAPVSAEFVFDRPTHQPDLLIGPSRSKLRGENVYDPSGESQTKQIRVRRGAVKTQFICVENDGQQRDAFFIEGTPGTSDFKVRYYFRGEDITEDFVAGGFQVGNVQPDSGPLFIRMTIKVGPRARAGSVEEFAVGATSRGEAIKADAVKVRVTAIGE